MGISNSRSNETSQVYITDGDTDVLTLLRQNVQLNCTTGSQNVAVHQLLWGTDTTKAFQRRHSRKGGNDDDDDDAHQRFDIILAADIVYAPVIVQPLWETISVLLRRTNTAKFIMAHARRQVPVTITDVIQAAEQAGFNHQLVAEDPDGIWIYEYTWKAEHIA